MSVELQAADSAVRPPSTPEASSEAPGAPWDRQRPNVAGDLPTVLEAPPMFRRSVLGYDRFQVF